MNEDKSINNGGLEVLFRAMSGENPSDVIREQEERGQNNFSEDEDKLPKEFNYGEEDLKDIYERMGIKVIGEYDDLFYKVILPEGWEIKTTDHSMWNELYDDKGRKRGSIFYKASFHDRKAWFNLKHRYTYSVCPVDRYKSDISFEERINLGKVGVVTDEGLDKEIYTTEVMKPDTKYEEDKDKSLAEDREIEEKLRDKVEEWLEENYPEYEDPFKYWD